MTFKTRKTLKLYRSIDFHGKVFRCMGNEEIVCEGDYCNSKTNPVDSGFITVCGISIGRLAKDKYLWYYREVK